MNRLRTPAASRGKCAGLGARDRLRPSGPGRTDPNVGRWCGDKPARRPCPIPLPCMRTRRRGPSRSHGGVLDRARCGRERVPPPPAVVGGRSDRPRPVTSRPHEAQGHPADRSVCTVGRLDGNLCKGGADGRHEKREPGPSRATAPRLRADHRSQSCVSLCRGHRPRLVLVVLPPRVVLFNSCFAFVFTSTQLSVCAHLATGTSPPAPLRAADR